MYKKQTESSIVRKGLCLLFLTATWLAGGTSLAQQAEADKAPSTGQAAAAAAANSAPVVPADSPMTGHLLQTTLGLLFVLGLLLALVWLLKRMGVGAAQKRGGFYKVLATSALGPRERIALVEVGNTWLVLGMTSHSINTLHSMPAGSIELDNPQLAAASFAKLLERVKTGKVKS